MPCRQVQYEICEKLKKYPFCCKICSHKLGGRVKKQSVPISKTILKFALSLSFIVSNSSHTHRWYFYAKGFKKYIYFSELFKVGQISPLQFILSYYKGSLAKSINVHSYRKFYFMKINLYLYCIYLISFSK